MVAEGIQKTEMNEKEHSFSSSPILPSVHTPKDNWNFISILLPTYTGNLSGTVSLFSNNHFLNFSKFPWYKWRPAPQLHPHRFLRIETGNASCSTSWMSLEVARFQEPFSHETVICHYGTNNSQWVVHFPLNQGFQTRIRPRIHLPSVYRFQ